MIPKAKGSDQLNDKDVFESTWFIRSERVDCSVLRAGLGMLAALRGSTPRPARAGSRVTGDSRD